MVQRPAGYTLSCSSAASDGYKRRSIWCVVLLGLPNALIYAGIWPLAIHDLGRFTKTGSSLLVMGLAGNAILPLIYGQLADSVGVRQAYWVLIPCFIYLIFYAVNGHKITSWTKNKP